MARTEGDASPGPHACVSCRGDSGTRGSVLQRETCRTDENTQCGWLEPWSSPLPPARAPCGSSHVTPAGSRTHSALREGHESPPGTGVR